MKSGVGVMVVVLLLHHAVWIEQSRRRLPPFIHLLYITRPSSAFLLSALISLSLSLFIPSHTMAAMYPVIVLDDDEDDVQITHISKCQAPGISTTAIPGQMQQKCQPCESDLSQSPVPD